MTFGMLHYIASQKLTNIYETLTATIIRVIRKPRAKNQMRYTNTPNKNEVWMDKWTTALLGRRIDGMMETGEKCNIRRWKKYFLKQW